MEYTKGREEQRVKDDRAERLKERVREKKSINITISINDQD